MQQPAPAARCGRTDSWFYNRRHRPFQKIPSPGVLYLDVQVEDGDPSANSRAGIRIFGFKDGLLNTKCIVVDRQVALFGWVSLDVRSFWLDFEVTLGVYDPDFAERLLALQDKYIEASIPVDLQTWHGLPVRFFNTFNFACGRLVTGELWSLKIYSGRISKQREITL